MYPLRKSPAGPGSRTVLSFTISGQRRSSMRQFRRSPPIASICFTSKRRGGRRTPNAKLRAFLVSHMDAVRQRRADYVFHSRGGGTPAIQAIWEKSRSNAIHLVLGFFNIRKAFRAACRRHEGVSWILRRTGPGVDSGAACAARWCDHRIPAAVSRRNGASARPRRR